MTQASLGLVVGVGCCSTTLTVDSEDVSSTVSNAVIAVNFPGVGTGVFSNDVEERGEPTVEDSKSEVLQNTSTGGMGSIPNGRSAGSSSRSSALVGRKSSGLFAGQIARTVTVCAL